MAKNLWNRWMKIAEKIGNFQATIIFSILFFVLITPMGVVLKLFNSFSNYKSESNWKKIVDNTSSLEKLKKQ